MGDMLFRLADEVIDNGVDSIWRVEQIVLHKKPPELLPIYACPKFNFETYSLDAIQNLLLMECRIHAWADGFPFLQKCQCCKKFYPQ